MNDTKLSPLSDIVSSVEDIKEELLEINANKDKYITCFTEMCWIITCAKGINKYITLQETLGFTDEEFYNKLNIIWANIKSIGVVSRNIKDIKDLVAKLDANPDLLEELKQTLDGIYAEFYMNLNDSKDEMLKFIQSATITAKTEILELVHLIPKMVSKDQLKAILADYPTTEALKEILSGYITQCQLDKILLDYISKDDAEDIIKKLVEEMLGNLTFDDINARLDDLENKINNITAGVYTAGANINISDDNVISATDTTYTAGANINISDDNVISATDTTYTAGANINISDDNVISVIGEIGESIVYEAGENITINGNVISAKDTNTTYTAGENISISDDNVISSSYKDTTYAAGENISIDENNIISAIIPETEEQPSYKAGDNITFTDNNDGSISINAEIPTRSVYDKTLSVSMWDTENLQYILPVTLEAELESSDNVFIILDTDSYNEVAVSGVYIYNISKLEDTSLTITFKCEQMPTSDILIRVVVEK